MSEPITIDGIQFVPVMESRGKRADGSLRYGPASLNGRALYALPGGLMAYETDLERIARWLKSTRIPHSHG
jgi:hypothetical protein